MGEGPSDLVGSIALGIMCKAPSPGTSKTRLSPPLSRDEAAALARCFIADMAGVIAGLPPELDICRFVVFTPGEAEGAFAALLPDGFGLLAQRGQDLRERCANAVEDLLARSGACACLLNADSP